MTTRTPRRGGGTNSRSQQRHTHWLSSENRQRQDHRLGMLLRCEHRRRVLLWRRDEGLLLMRPESRRRVLLISRDGRLLL